MRTSHYAERRSMARKVMVPLLGVVLAGLVTACSSEAAQEGNTTSSPVESGSPEGGGQLGHIGRPASPVVGSSFVSPLASIYGDVFIGQGSFVAANTIMRAAPDKGIRVEVGNQSNIQDNVIVRALEAPVIIGDQTSLSHHAIVRDSTIGNSVYIGYSAEVRNSRVGDGAFIYVGAQVDGVKIPENSFVGPGEQVTDQATADALPKVEDVNMGKYYNVKEHLDINKELAKAYIELYEEQGYASTVDIGPNPKIYFNPEQFEPQIDETVNLEEFARIVGDVQIAEHSLVRQRATIRADEGTPISIGRGAIIGNRVTFHALRGTEIRIGEYLAVSDDAVLHGPLEMGNENVVGDDTVVFRVRVGDNVQIGEGAIVVGPAGKELTLEIPDDTLIPAGAIVTSEKDLEALKP